jgi:gluconate 2-dehydrogenase subunit 3-like protein
MADSEQAPRNPSRRRALKSLGVAAGALAVVPTLSDAGTAAFRQAARSGVAPKLKVMTAAEYAAVDALADTIIPTDVQSPGAHAARVADYIDLLLSESPAATKAVWKDGVAAVDGLARSRFKTAFARLTPSQRIEVVTDMARHEAAPQTPVEAFFVAAKDWTIRGYYTSEIGIHKDLRYQGNQFLGEFVGCAEVPATAGTK